MYTNPHQLPDDNITLTCYAGNDSKFDAKDFYW